ncbi:DUF4760 domain-containing protein [Legionella birminghamensis]|uniref:DUF4760 domain-containing protein n=1 Tax=Legionella birminghamensis TaxID=28083 RepID=UPI003B50E2A3
MEARELLGNSIIYYFDIFKPFIEMRRSETNDNKFYEHFENLYNDVKNYTAPPCRCFFCNFFNK